MFIPQCFFATFHVCLLVTSEKTASILPVERKNSDAVVLLMPAALFLAILSEKKAPATALRYDKNEVHGASPDFTVFYQTSPEFIGINQRSDGLLAGGITLH